MQIQANELRIGNLLNYDPNIKNCPIKAIPIDIDDIKLCQEGQWEWHHFYTPIPITEELLLKFGFSQSPAFKSLFFVGTFLNITLGNKIMFEINDRIISEIKYVHQLQNLYFSLTGKELEICK